MKLEEYRKITSGARSKHIGQAFENIIDISCKRYKRNGTAYIEKTPEPVKVLNNKNGKITGFFEKKGQPDFKGTMLGGRSVCFEAKATEKDRIEQSRVQEHQAESLEIHYKMGAIVFVLVCFKRECYYRIPWEIWKNMKCIYGRKYLKEDDIQEYQVPFENGFINFLKED